MAPWTVLNSQRTQKSLQHARRIYNYARSIAFFYILFRYSVKARRHVRARGLSCTVQDISRWLTKQCALLFLRLPAMQQRVQSELSKAKMDIEAKLAPRGTNLSRNLSLPPTGRSSEWILSEMEKMDREFMGNAIDWRSGKISGAVYHGGDDLSELISQTIRRYLVSNPLHPDIFPSVRKMEAEIVAMCLRMYNCPEGAGVMTSGGTESIIMAVKTHRDRAREMAGVTEPEMIVPSSAHAAFDKAAAYLRVKIHTIPIDPTTRKVDIYRVKKAINGNTILLVGSAVNFPDGNQDPITALASLAQSHGIGMHVDCCLGSFIVPFLEAAGLSGGDMNGMFKLEEFDFRVKGVTSISCDTHKYGFAPKGTSVIMYKSADLRHYQYYVNPDWTGGVYGSPSIAGSRPGSLIAGTWAVMQYMGADGYLESCRSIVTAARRIADAINSKIPSLYVLGSPPASVVAFASRDPSVVNVMEVGDRMNERGWHLNAIGSVGGRDAEGVTGVHIAVTKMTVPLVDTFIADLQAAVEEARINPSGKGTMVSIYGLGNSSVVGPTMVGQLATVFLDTLYKA